MQHFFLLSLMHIFTLSPAGGQPVRYGEQHNHMVLPGIVDTKQPDGKTNDQAMSPISKSLPGLTPSRPLVQLSQEFVYASRTGENTEVFIEKFKLIPFNELTSQLDSDREKKAFWINLYNGFTQVLLKKNPEKYQDKGNFFKTRAIEIAGKMMSLDDIEHGILRRSKTKWSLGYVNKLFPGKDEKTLRVSATDYRIHFALNCGAKSCPPIAFYKTESLDQQLDLATQSYLGGEAIYDGKTVQVPAILSWFRGDFGGKKGIIRLLQKEGIVPEGVKPGIVFKTYDWSIYLNNYTN